MKETFPLSLVLAWVAAVALTAGTIFTGNLIGSDAVPLGGPRLAILVLITTLKGFLILHYYLNFRLAPKSWQRASYFFIFLLLACAAVLFVCCQAEPN